jgi:hypothetical protein
MNDPVLLGISTSVLALIVTAIATIVMAFAAIASWRVSGRLEDMQQRLIELQKRANWLTGALESHSAVNMRLSAEKQGKKVIWWDPTNDGPIKRPPPARPTHLESALSDTVYVYVPPEDRRYPDIT